MTTRMIGPMRGCLQILLLIIAWATLASSQAVNAQTVDSNPVEPNAENSVISRGETLYKQMCAECHGNVGQGVEGAYDRPLTGDLAISQLAEVIDKTMPEGNPSACSAEESAAIAQYAFQAFYGELAQNRLKPPKQLFSRLTAEQFRQSVSDVYFGNDWFPRPENKRGLAAEYFRSAKHKKEDRVLERIDPVINIDFGRESPGKGIEPKEFAIVWNAGLRVDHSGSYEIVVRSTCSFTLKFGRHDRTLIDNHVQSGDKVEFRETVFLTAGRVYPVRLEFFQRERKTELPPASISMSWVIPGGVEQLIPEENWIPGWAPAQYSVQTALPPDDRSYGFERGIKVDRDWDSAVTTSAIDFAQVVAKEQWPDFQRKNKDKPNENRQLLKEFLREKLNVAFRYQMNDALAVAFVDNQVAKEADDVEAIKRVLLIGLKSPRFLYPYADIDQSPSARHGTRLALCLLDSLPNDQQLRSAIEKGKLESEEQIRNMARHLIGDHRAQAKTRAMINEWLNIAVPKDRKKNAEHFSGFDDQLVQDSRRSIDAMISDIVFSDSSDYRLLFSADWTYTTPRMLQYYGPAWEPAEPFSEPIGPSQEQIMEARPVPLKKTVARDKYAGVLTHPYLMSGLAYFDSSSPIHRGVFILRNLLGRQIQPPQDAAFTPLSPDLHPDLTTRERVNLQTSPDSCDSCHNRINSLGFALENWDAAGRFRDQERNKPVDPRGYYTNRDGQRIEFMGSKELAEYVKNSRDAHQAFVRRAFQHFAKQPPAAYGPDTLDRLTQQFIDRQFNIRELLVEIAVVASKPAQQQDLAALQK